MFDLDKWQEIFATISKNKLRTALTALSVFWGIFMLIFMLGMGKGLQNGIMQGFGDHATNSAYVWGQRTTKAYQGLKPGRIIRFSEQDMEAIRAYIPEIERLAPRVQKGSVVVKYKTKTSGFELFGDTPYYQYINPMSITKGRALNEYDIKESRKVIVIGARVVDLLFKDKEPIGEYVNVSGIYFQVVGVMKSRKPNQEWAAAENGNIFIPFSTMQKCFNRDGKINYFCFTAKGNTDVLKVENKVKALLRSRLGVAPDDVNAIGSENLQRQYGEVMGLFIGIDSLIWFVGICTIIAGVIGVSNIMLIVVKERTKEIGVRKAMGATPWSIITLIVQEAVFITTASGYVGIIVGIAVVEAVHQFTKDMNGEMFVRPETNLTIVISATIFLIVCGAFAGMMPALRAAAISPVEALRDE